MSHNSESGAHRPISQSADQIFHNSSTQSTIQDRSVLSTTTKSPGTSCRDTLDRLRKDIDQALLGYLPGLEHLHHNHESDPAYLSFSLSVGILDDSAAPRLRGLEVWVEFESVAGEGLTPTMHAFVLDPDEGAWLNDGICLQEHFKHIAWDVEFLVCQNRKHVVALSKYLFLLAAEQKLHGFTTHNIPYNATFRREIVTLCERLRSKHSAESNPGSLARSSTSAALVQTRANTPQPGATTATITGMNQRHDSLTMGETPQARAAEVLHQKDSDVWHRGMEQEIHPRTFGGLNQITSSTFVTQSAPRLTDMPTPKLRSSTANSLRSAPDDEDVIPHERPNPSKKLHNGTALNSGNDTVSVDEIKVLDRIQDNTKEALANHRNNLKTVQARLKKARKQLQTLGQGGALGTSVTAQKHAVYFLEEREKVHKHAVEMFKKQQQDNDESLKRVGM